MCKLDPNDCCLIRIPEYAKQTHIHKSKCAVIIL